MNVVHRDLKPENFLFREQGRRHLKVRRAVVVVRVRCDTHAPTTHTQTHRTSPNICEISGDVTKSPRAPNASRSRRM